MADAQSPESGQFPPPQPPRERQGSLSLSHTGPPQPSGPQNEGTSPSNGGAVQAPAAQTSDANGDGDVPPQVQEVLASELGVPTMLNQLKASIGSTKEFALFLKKRSAIEESHASALKKLARTSNETMHLPDHKDGSFAHVYTEMMYVHERMAENGMQFALSLHRMHDDLVELAAVAERSRKGWKTNGLAPEQRVAELEAALKKSKTKYDSLADEYDRARTGDTSRQPGKMFSLKAKSGPQHEEELLRKVQNADQDYQGKVQHWQSERQELVSRTRPEAVKALRELVKETDSGVLLQMQKFASFSEKLLLSNGLSISPIKDEGSQNGPRTLREAVLAVNNEKDLHDYVSAYHPKLPTGQGEIKYERNPVLNPQQSLASQQPPQSQLSISAPQAQFSAPNTQDTAPTGMSESFQQSSNPQAAPGQGPAFAPGSMPPPGAQGQRQAPTPHNRSFSQGNLMNQPRDPQQQQPQLATQPSRNSALPASRFNAGAPQLGALPFQGASQEQQRQPSPDGQPQSQWQPGTNPLQQHPPSAPSQGGGSPQHRPSPPPGSSSTPSRPVFGLTLDALYERDGLAVPMVVYQCIQAIDLFGLGVEGIYRQSGSVNHINKLKHMFDTDSSNPALDFRNPENFYHDVNSVTGLLKQFLRDLSDPLLTTAQHASLIEAAKHEDDILRRDSLHSIINNLPDPNYATLRALTLHLHRIMDNSHVNRMNNHNLAVIFGPTLMGTDPSTSIGDAGWQIKAIDTILQNTYQIFDED